MFLSFKTVPLNTVLSNGDTVEILSSDSQSPNYSWLKFAVTSKEGKKPPLDCFNLNFAASTSFLVALIIV